MTDEQKAEYEYLQWFYQNCDFGPADSDVRKCLNDHYEMETGAKVPEGYEVE